ncbi:hypothetical protein B0H11DRAFT_505496 [Mycena galericulata]|nr:hypothetical protein B0H11DRAFT_505496 [Mycena galericulata]
MMAAQWHSPQVQSSPCDLVALSESLRAARFGLAIDRPKVTRRVARGARHDLRSSLLTVAGAKGLSSQCFSLTGQVFKSTRQLQLHLTRSANYTLTPTLMAGRAPYTLPKNVTPRNKPLPVDSRQEERKKKLFPMFALDNYEHLRSPLAKASPVTEWNSLPSECHSALVAKLAMSKRENTMWLNS